MDNINYIIIENRKVPFIIKELDIFEIRYFKENPRINFILSKTKQEHTEELIEKTLWDFDYVKKLAEDIEENGGLLEEIIVLNGVVIEGNSRLCAYRNRFRDSIPEKKDFWRKIRCKVILEDLKLSEQFNLLGNLHIKGKTQWDPYEKASYIYKMINESHLPEEVVAKMLGTTKNSVSSSLKTYEIMRDKYLPKIPVTSKDNRELKKFSIFEEYFKSNNLQDLSKSSPEVINDDIFTKWVLEERVNSAVFDVRKDLYDILKHKESRNIFINSEIPQDAIDLAKENLNWDKPYKSDPFYDKLKKITTDIENCEMKKIQDDLKSNPNVLRIIKNFYRISKNFYKNLDIDDPNKEFIKRN